MKNDTPLYSEEVKDFELFNLAVSMTALQKKIEVLNGSFEQLLHNFEKLEKKNSAVVKEVEHIKLFGDEISKIESNSNSPKIVLNSVEFQTLIDYLVPIIEGSIDTKMKSFFSETSNELKNGVMDFKKEQKELLKILSSTSSDNTALKKELIEKSKELNDARESIFYLTNYIQEFTEEVKKLKPLIEKDDGLERDKNPHSKARKKTQKKVSQKDIADNSKNSKNDSSVEEKKEKSNSFFSFFQIFKRKVNS